MTKIANLCEDGLDELLLHYIRYLTYNTYSTKNVDGIQMGTLLIGKIGVGGEQN